MQGWGSFVLASSQLEGQMRNWFGVVKMAWSLKVGALKPLHQQEVDQRRDALWQHGEDALCVTDQDASVVASVGHQYVGLASDLVCL